MSARYAVYYAPALGDPLTVAAAKWLGRDAWTGADLVQPHVDGLEELDLVALTEDPRHYGFHATLKAPFELHPDRIEEELLEALVDVCTKRPAFIASITPSALSAFIAFRLSEPSAPMQALHEVCVREFEPFRAPLSEADIARRRKAKLTPLQDERLLEFGYPYIFDEFRFHMTLTGAVRDAGLRDTIIGALQRHFAPFSGAHHFSCISVFKQDMRSTPFKILAQVPFGANVAVQSR